jgi:peptidoglycan/xylan/chitin deacetylase (PgdA/CDA1 family)
VTPRADSSLAVLAYRRVDEPGRDGDPAFLSTTPWAFEEQFRHLTSTYNVLGAETLGAVRQGDATLPARSVVLTFDYPYCDFARVAWPILRRFEVPVTLFVSTADLTDPGREFWWERLYRSISTTVQTYVDLPFGRMSTTTPTARAYAYRVILGSSQDLTVSPGH